MKRRKEIMELQKMIFPILKNPNIAYIDKVKIRELLLEVTEESIRLMPKIDNVFVRIQNIEI